MKAKSLITNIPGNLGLLLVMLVAPMTAPAQTEIPYWYENPPQYEGAIIVVEKGAHQAEALIVALASAIENIQHNEELDSLGGQTTETLNNMKLAGHHISTMKKYPSDQNSYTSTQLIEIVDSDSTYMIKYFKENELTSFQMVSNEGGVSMMTSILRDHGIRIEYHINDSEAYVMLIIPNELHDDEQ